MNAQILYFSHGRGPLPLLNDPSHSAMIEFMKKLPGKLKKPDCIVVISAHWEENTATVLGADQPEMLYDYYGFPPEAYNIRYSAAGSPECAEEITAVLNLAGCKAQINSQRGFNHGLFIPLLMMYPKADIPSIQLSLLHSLDPAKHIQLGKALQPMLGKNILFIGSGFSFHNMQAFMPTSSSDNNEHNNAFQDWLIETCASDISTNEREKRLTEWEKAPYARYCHPREEHLLPLHVCSGLAGKQAECIFDDNILKKRAVAFLW